MQLLKGSQGTSVPLLHTVDIIPKNTVRETDLSSSQAITMPVRPFPVLLKTLGML